MGKFESEPQGELLAAAQMRSVEQAAIRGGVATGLELMERAGRGVVEAVFAQWPALAASPHRAVVLCGPGNNGGDGFVVARLLKDWGWEVDLYLFGAPDTLPPDARVNHDRWAAQGAVHPLAAFSTHTAPAALYLDALFGTGLGRPLEGAPAEAMAALAGLERHGARLVATDILSGICADSGKILGDATLPSAGLTVTFHRAKTGHFLGDGAHRSGVLRIVDIGVPAEWRAADDLDWPSVVHLVDLLRFPAAAALSKPGALREVHKYGHGHALVVSGPMGRSGAARLAARGASRVGAGLVTVAAPGSAMMECAAQLTAIMLRRADDAGALAELLRDDRLNAVCLGPGLGVGQGARDLAAAALAETDSSRAVVLDADALVSFEGDPQALFDLIHPNCVLTPHGGEFARLFPDLAETLHAPATTGPAPSKVDVTRAAAARAGCTVLFKGAGTVIAEPGGRAAINAALHDHAAPWLATAGSGDVLAGMISGLLARGAAPFQAAQSAAWLHAEAARAYGPGLIAEDLPEMLPQVFRALGV